MKHQNPLAFSAIFVVSLALLTATAGCGGGGGGGGAAEPRGSTVTGTLLDAATEAPIASATVTVATSSGVTDGNGTYTLTDVPTGSQGLRAAANGYLRFPADGAPPFYVTVVPGTTTLGDLLLVPASQPPPPPL